MHGVGGPLPLNFATQQWSVQKAILKRMRALGIVPVLPSFQGNVPPALKALHPTANITLQKAHWGGGTAAWLDATDALFQTIGNALMSTLIADFGIDVDGDGIGDTTEHWYEADGYVRAARPRHCCLLLLLLVVQPSPPPRLDTGIPASRAPGSPAFRPVITNLTLLLGFSASRRAAGLPRRAPAAPHPGAEP